MSAVSKKSAKDGREAAQLGQKFLTFFLDEEEYGIEILSVREIIGLLPVTPVPESPHYVRGIVNLRGQVVPVVDLRVKFSMAPAPNTDETCIVVVRCSAGELGLVVDRVSEVLDIPEGEIVEPPSVGSEMRTDFLLGIGKVQGKVVLLLDIEVIFAGVEALDFDVAA